MPNLEWSFILKIDSCKYGVGGVLEQEDPVSKQRYVIEYCSKKYNETQQRYPAIELECCGLIFAIKHWNCYLVGKPFIIETDSKAIQWLKGKRDMLNKLGRWSLFLENYEFSTVHISGKNHCVPDALSRVYEPESPHVSEITANNAFLKTLPDSVDINDWCDEISQDPQLTKLVDKSIELKNDFYVKCDNSKILVVPKSARNEILSLLHDNLGHPGIQKLLYRVQERYFWPNLSKDVKDYCNKCHSCAVNKDNRAPNNAPLVPIETSALNPFQKVGMDILGPLPETDDGHKYLIVLQDYFTKWPEAVSLKNIDTNTIQSWLTSEIIPRFGIFPELVTDQGVQFVSSQFEDFCKSTGIRHDKTSPYHPQTDGMVERFNRSFLNMIRNYVDENQKDWSTHIPLIMFAYRTNVHDTLGFSPAEVLQGRKLPLPIDIMRPPTLNFEDDFSSIDELFDKMKMTRASVRTKAEKAAVNRKRHYDSTKRVIRTDFKPGDLVYWKRPTVKKGLSPKLQQIWQGPFTVKSQLSDLNFVLTDETDKSITVHVNNLKECKDRNMAPRQIRTRGRPRKQK